MKKQGRVYLIGAGPGDPGLITLKGMELLKTCDAVVYDHLASDALLEWTQAGCKRIFVGKQIGHHSMKQEEINSILLNLAQEGLTVARLKGGDPFVFGRGGEEALALEQAGIPYESVPGVTSAVAVPECAGIPVTHREVSRSFHVITGHTQSDRDCLPPDLELYGTLPGTLVFLMGLKQLPLIVKGLIQGGKPCETPAAVIEKGTLPDQRVVRGSLMNLEEKVMEAGLKTPAIIVVGEVAAYEMYSSLDKPLSGLRVGIIGTEHFAGKLKASLEAKGALCTWIYAMELISRENTVEMREIYRRLDTYSWVVFTSANGVRLFFRGLLKTGRDFRALGGLKFAVIGSGTAEKLYEYGFRPDYMPHEYSAKALGRGLAPLLTKEDHILIPRSRGGSKELIRELERSEASLKDLVLYEVKGRKKADEIGRAELYDYLVFASASGVTSFFENTQSLLLTLQSEEKEGKTPKLACIGHITASALEAMGLKADVMAKSYDIRGLAEAIERCAKGQSVSGALKRRAKEG